MQRVSQFPLRTHIYHLLVLGLTNCFVLGEAKEELLAWRAFRRRQSSDRPIMPPSSFKRGGDGGSSSADAKKPRRPIGDDDDDDDMDALIAEAENDEDETEFMQGQAPPAEDEPEVKLLGQKDMAALEAAWRRPPLPPLDPATDEVTFQQFEADYAVGSIPPDFARGSNESKAATVRLFGVTKGGHSVVAHVHGFRPYFYVRAPPGFGQNDLAGFQQALTARLKSQVPAKDQTSQCVLHCGLVNRQSIMHFNFKQMQPFIRIVTALPSMVATARRLLEQGIMLPKFGAHQFDTFESNCAYALRYMVDRDIVGCSWVTLPKGAWRARPWVPSGGNISQAEKPCTLCQLEVDVWFSDVVAHGTEGEHMDIAPMRILSFDIECAGRPGVFPEAEVDPVIQIANHIVLQGKQTTVVKNIFTLKECAPISGAQVLSFDTEEEMLRSWHQFLIASDCDILTGYNIINFDLPYLLNRAVALKIKSFPCAPRHTSCGRVPCPRSLPWPRAISRGPVAACHFLLTLSCWCHVAGISAGSRVCRRASRTRCSSRSRRARASPRRSTSRAACSST